ncbi:hypothetical protein V2L05_09065 [Pseudomonas alliivorans]|uniref:DUF7693 family protein n=1 Tax=Pseudomonas alliivorans TaxID=2810613 RepID=UPI001AE38E03|nr:hypothetical protein [Pseudomonas alliivorans]MBP0950533.1 hypothetical protein [Pseudomonas alliivorans]MEE4622183.1 hypothetical protein [Pseudomonas alliivorans]MEE4669366.1 hypothetical protein [Pseudomonas alliivorans]MEE4753613.1 hypothetical protein [Pseudomonas alliivorans]MEE5038545.1 hypothetical protein [Pseudomonas alliivorans]
MRSTSTLSAREVYQRLKEAALGVRSLRRLDDCESNPIRIDIEGWRLTLEISGSCVTGCLHCLNADGQQGTAEDWPRTDPVSLLSGWEQAQIERLVTHGYMNDDSGRSAFDQ